MRHLLKEKKKFSLRTVDILAAIILLIYLLISVYSSYFYYKSCNDESCFSTYLGNCDRANYIKESNLSLRYNILGYSMGACSVKVSLISNDISYNLGDSYKNSVMFCRLPLGIKDYPESNLGKCTGLLKEGIQEVLINRLKIEIIRNIDELNLNVLTGP